jgi:flagellar hook-associated protein 3 FlgL
MNQISTSSAYGSVLTALMTAESQQSQIGAQISSGQTASDLKGYGAAAGNLTDMQAANTQIGGYLTQANVVGAQLSVQDAALQQVAGAGASARLAVENVIAAGNGTTLMQSLQSAFQTAVNGLNTTYNGQYLFSGGQSTTQPVTATNLTDLTAVTPPASVFQNGQLITTAQLDPSTNVSTGFLADQVGSPLFNALQAIEAFNQGPDGPFSGPLTATQSSFLQAQLSTLTTVNTGLTNVAAQNGIVQSQVTATQGTLTNQQTMLAGLMSNITSADLATASTNLQQVQLSIQASEQVLISLKSTSLLNLLSPTGAA